MHYIYSARQNHSSRKLKPRLANPVPIQFLLNEHPLLMPLTRASLTQRQAPFVALRFNAYTHTPAKFFGPKLSGGSRVIGV